MASVNKVVLVGHLGRDPEVRSFQNGGKICNLRVATGETWKDRQTGERKERTEWHAVTIHADHAVKYAEQYLRKGSMVYIEGKLETRKWQDQQGQDRYTTEVVVRPYGGEVQGLDKREGGGRRDDDRDPRRDDRGGSAYGGRTGGAPDMDDEIPFGVDVRL